MSLSNNYPTIRPTLEFDFANVGALDPRITFTRATSATFVNQLGLIQTAASGIPRFDYDPVTLAARGLLVEEQRTNLMSNSEDFSGWTLNGSTVTTNTVSAPDGTTTADTITGSSGNFRIYNLLTLSSGQAYTFSWFAKKGTSDTLQIDFVNVLNGPIFTFSTESWSASGSWTTTVQKLGNGWYRLTATATSNTTTAGPGIRVSGASATAYIWGFQVEAGSFATSYIPTLASTVTRNADVASVNTLSPWYNATEGVLYAEAIAYAARVSGNPIGIASITDGGANNRVSLAFLNNATDNLSRLVAGGVSVLNATGGGASVNALSKIAAAYKSGDSAGVANGTLVQTASTSFSLSVANLVIGSGIPVTEPLCGYIRRLAYYPVRLTDAQLQALTS